MRDLDTLKCMTSLFKQLVLGCRVATIYTKRHNTCFPQVEFPFTALTSETQHIREPDRGRPQGTPAWHIHPGSLFHTHTGQALCKSQKLAVGHTLPELPDSFLPPLTNCLLFKSCRCPNPPLKHLKFISH